MNFKSKATWIGLLVIMVNSSMASPAQAGEQTFEELIFSRDVVLEPAAASGAPVSIVARPARIDAGRRDDPNRGRLIAAIIEAWKANPNGMLPRDLIPRPGNRISDQRIGNGEFTADVGGWTAVNAYGGAASFGAIAPAASSADGRFAVLHTGPWDDAAQGSLEQIFRVHRPAELSVALLYNFVTTEWPQQYGQQWNDNAAIVIHNVAGTEVKFAFSTSLNEAEFTPVSGLPEVINAGRGQSGGTTGWRRVGADPLYYARGEYRIRIEVNDVADRRNDSALLVDQVSLR